MRISNLKAILIRQSDNFHHFTIYEQVPVKMSVYVNSSSAVTAEAIGTEVNNAKRQVPLKQIFNNSFTGDSTINSEDRNYHNHRSTSSSSSKPTAKTSSARRQQRQNLSKVQQSNCSKTYNICRATCRCKAFTNDVDIATRHNATSFTTISSKALKISARILKVREHYFCQLIVV